MRSPGRDEGVRRCGWKAVVVVEQRREGAGGGQASLGSFGLLGAVCRLDVPIFAARFILRTLTHSATAAPELSMTLTMVW